MRLAGYRRTMTVRDHAAYIEAVAAALNEREIATSDIRITYEEGVRHAAIQITPEEDHAFTTADSLYLTWNQRDGWAFIPHYPAGSGLGTSSWHYGPGVMPSPETLAAWADLLTMRPDVTPSHDLPATAGPATDLETELTKYQS